MDIDESNIDDSIQINEISSSDNNESASSLLGPFSRLRKPSTSTKKVTTVIQQSSAERKVTRSSLASTARVTRSTGTETRASVARSSRKVAVIIQKPSTSQTGRVHKENISLLRKVPVKALKESAIVTASRTRSSDLPQQNEKLVNQRTLRSQNALTKDTADKSLHRTNQTVAADVNNFIQQIGRVVTQAKVYSVSTRANNNTKSNVNSGTNGACKKQPKRLINTDSVQIVKSKLPKSSESSQARASTLRFKVVVAKKSIVEQLSNVNSVTRPTRRMRLQQ